MITPGSDADIFYITVTGTVHCRHRLRPLSGLCLVTSSVSYQGVIFVLHSRLTLSCRHRVLSTVILKRKNSGDPTVPARGLSSGTTGRVRPTLLACLAPARISRELPNHESRALPRVTRDKVRRRFTLLVTAVTWWDDRAGIDVTGGPDCCR